MGKHKYKPLMQKLKKALLPRSKFMPASDMERHRDALAEIYRSRFGLSLHPLQTSPSVVPPADLIDNVQGRNKSDLNTFFGSGFRSTLNIIELLQAHGYDITNMDRMLDFGVGVGRVLLQFLPFRMERHGCDVNPVAVDWTAKALGEHATLRISDPEPPLPYDNGVFDMALALAVFVHIPVNQQGKWVAELGRIVKPGGCVIGTTHDISRMETAGKKVDWSETGVDRGLHMNSYLTPAKLKEIWAPAFDILEIRRYPGQQTHFIARRTALA